MKILVHDLDDPIQVWVRRKQVKYCSCDIFKVSPNNAANLFTHKLCDVCHLPVTQETEDWLNQSMGYSGYDECNEHEEY